MKKKYALALLLAVSMAFAACGQKTDNDPEESSFLTEQLGGVQVTSLGALDGVWFNSDDDLMSWDIIDMDGVWQDAEGETLVIDRNRMEYLACTSEMFRTGTIYDNYDGKGLYLYLNGYAYVCPGTDGFSFTLAFEPSEYEEANGTFTGVFSDNIEEFVYDPAQDWGDDWMTSLWD